MSDGARCHYCRKVPCVCLDDNELEAHLRLKASRTSFKNELLIALRDRTVVNRLLEIVKKGGAL
jgi:hypothetical protein